MTALLNFWLSFLAGLSAPLFAVCVLPLYPGFLAYLSNNISSKSPKRTIMLLGLIVTFGVITSMSLVGLIFTLIFGASLTNAIGIISPIAFGILGLVSILLIFNFNFSRFIPKAKTPRTKNPYVGSFLFGLFFGAIVLPCNPASLIVLFALSSSAMSTLLNFINFIAFGVGMGLPLLLFSIISGNWSKSIIGFLSSHTRSINFITGLTMLGISLYYLIYVFRIFG